MFGGVEENAYVSEMYVLEISQMKWRRITISGDTPSNRLGHCMHAINEYEIVVFGGVSENIMNGTNINSPFEDARSYKGILSNDLFIFNIIKSEWTRIESPNPPSPRSFFASCVSGNKIYIHGGYIAEVEISDELFILTIADTDQPRAMWTRVPVSLARAGHSMVTSNTNSLLIFGDHKMQDSDIYEFALDKDSERGWTQVQTHGTKPHPRRLTTLSTVGQKIFLLGGETSIKTGDVYVLSQTETGEYRWSKPLYEKTLTIRGHATCVFGDKLMVYGGMTLTSDSSRLVISKKLFFVNALEIRTSDIEDTGGYRFKFVTVGDSGVGKSCLLTRFVSDVYNDQHVSTIGVDYKTVLTMVKGRLVKLQLWDTAGQERFNVVTGNYYRNADAFLIVYDATNRTSFEHVEAWVNQIKQYHDFDSKTVRVLCANKIDTAIEVSAEEGEEKAKSINAIFVQTSAKTSTNVDLAFLTATQRLVEIGRNADTNIHRPIPSHGVNLATQIPTRLASFMDKQMCCSS